jgi:N-methylhydantoinase A
MSTRIGIDIGGTFTDLVALDDSGDLKRWKVATTPRAAEGGLLTALHAFLTAVPAPDVTLIAHASTIATNALLGQVHLELPRVAFITTEGFRDVLEIGRQNRSAIYDLNVKRPVPLARREDRLTVRERRLADGSVRIPLDMTTVATAIEAVRSRGIRSVAVGLLHSDINDDHERAIADAFAAALPEVTVSLSASINREYREYERFSTAVVNAALVPIVRDYLARVADGVRSLGIDAPIFVMRSDGGMSSIDAAVARPATLIESGPASGVIGAAYLGRALGIENVLSFDMGGTTAKAGTVLGGKPEVATEFEAAGSTHSGRAVKGSGYPVRFPFVDLAEVSAGGGTIAWLDGAGSLRVGPLSAGADPGPACYGHGDRPTVTDANVVLRRLNPRALLEGAFPIESTRSTAAVESVAGILAGDVAATAAGIVALVDSEMSKVLRIVSVERGYDPRDFTLVAFGGGGPLHACAVADEIGVRRIVIPPLPGVFSAYGLLAADVRVSFVRSIVAPANDATWTSVRTILADLARDGDVALAEQGVAHERRTLVAEIDVRYAGQSFDLSVPHTERLSDVIETFHTRHERRYGFSARADAIEIVNARVVAVGTTIKPPLGQAPPRTTERPPTPREQREVWNDGRFSTTPVFGRADLQRGDRIAGPAVIEQYDATTYIAPAWHAEIDPFGNLVIEHR